MPRTITIPVPDRPDDALAMYRAMFTPAFLAGILDAALRHQAAHLDTIEADGPWPDVLDLCPCPDCDTQILWTRLHDVRTAWAVHQCPPREGDAL